MLTIKPKKDLSSNPGSNSINKSGDHDHSEIQFPSLQNVGGNICTTYLQRLQGGGCFANHEMLCPCDDAIFTKNCPICFIFVKDLFLLRVNCKKDYKKHCDRICQPPFKCIPSSCLPFLASVSRQNFVGDMVVLKDINL